MEATKDIKIYTCDKGKQRHKSNNRRIYGPGIRQLYVIHHILSGKGVFETGGKKYYLSAGDSFIIFPGITVCYYPDKNDEWEYIWVDFLGKEVGEILSHTSFSIENPVVRACENNILSAFKELNSLFLDKSNPVREYHLKAALYRLLSEYILTYPVANTESANIMERIVSYINNNYSNPALSVEDIKAEFGLGHMTVYRYFKGAFNTTPKKYINSVRIEKASFLLHTTKQTVKEIALSVGFSDPLYFSKVFKEKTGISPSVYHIYYKNFLL